MNEALRHFENRFALKPVLAGVAGVTYFITGHEQTRTESACFISLVISLLPKLLSIRGLFILTATGVVPNGGR